ncbi:MAG: hypothetical protein RLZZ262_211 [Bacteroidota bacterium]|jgi:hypothetical protein
MIYNLISTKDRSGVDEFIILSSDFFAASKRLLYHLWNLY